MISLSIGLLYNFAIIDSGDKYKNLQYFFHNLKHNSIFRLYNFGHILVKLNFLIPIAFNNIIFAHESTHVTDNSTA